MVQNTLKIFVYSFLFTYSPNITKLYYELRNVLGLKYTEVNKKDVLPDIKKFTAQQHG